MQPLNVGKALYSQLIRYFLQNASDKIMLWNVMIDLFNKAFCEKAKVSKLLNS